MKLPWAKPEPLPLDERHYHEEIRQGSDPDCKHLWWETLPWTHTRSVTIEAKRCVDCGMFLAAWSDWCDNP